MSSVLNTEVGPDLDPIFSKIRGHTPFETSEVYNHRNDNIINPHLDVIETRSSHILADGREKERPFTIEPIILPDLEHTGICPSLHETERLLFYQSNKKNTNIRANLNATLRASSILEYHPQEEEPLHSSQTEDSNDHQFSHMRMSTSDVITARSQAKSILSMIKTHPSKSLDERNINLDNTISNKNNPEQQIDNNTSSIRRPKEEEMDLDQSNVLYNNIHGDDGLLLQETGTDFNDLPKEGTLPVEIDTTIHQNSQSNSSSAESSKSYVQKIRHLMEPSPPNMRHLTTSSNSSSNSYNHYLAIAQKK